jgi:hypothetical protein
MEIQTGRGIPLQSERFGHKDDNGWQALDQQIRSLKLVKFHRELFDI